MRFPVLREPESLSRTATKSAERPPRAPVDRGIMLSNGFAPAELRAAPFATALVRNLQAKPLLSSIMTAVIERSRWKYRMARAYRVLLTEAGHLCQVFYLVATALGLAPFCTMALADSVIEQDLRLDAINESVLYVAGVGLPQ